MDVDFCSQCENLLYLYIDKQDNSLHHKCKSCGFSKKLENKNIEINNNTKINVTKCDIINHNPFITADITIPSIKDNKNIKCLNPDCDAETIHIKYLNYDQDNLKYIYICNQCGHSWTYQL